MGAKLNSWQDFHDKFKLLANEQDGMPEDGRLCVYRDRNPRAADRGPFSDFFGKPPEMGPWTIRKSLLQKKFEALATQAGTKLGPGRGFGHPSGFWLDCLYDYLLNNVSPQLSAGGQGREVMKSICEASAAYCSWLETKALEAAASAERRDAKRGKLGASQAGASDNPSNTRNPKRLSASINSPIAARRMEEHWRSKDIRQTDFAIQVGTTDRTLRNFRKNGKVRRDIFENIAKALGTTKDALRKTE